ncbi:MAG: SurA N-terminal domain-containing protein [Pirellulales bacterium]
MSSPFSVFRKHQKGMMAGLIIVAMVSFVVLGTAQQFFDSRGHSDPQADRVIATWKGGKFTQNDISRFAYDRASLNQFTREVAIVEARNHGVSEGRMPRQYDTDSEKKLVVVALLVEQAKELGIVVTDEQVTQEIKSLSNDAVSGDQLRAIVRKISNEDRPVTYAQIVEAFRREIMARQAQLVYGSVSRNFDDLATPAQRWDYFCRLNRRVSMQVYPFPVEKYISDPRIPDPTDSLLQAFYDKYKNDEQSPISPEPGFKLPDGVKLEYLRADYLKFYEAAKANLTDEEIRADFEKRKVGMRDNLEFDEGMGSYRDPFKGGESDEPKGGDKPVVKAPEPDPTPYETAVGRFAKRAPRPTEPEFTDEEILNRNRESIVKRLAEVRAREDMRKALDEAYQKMFGFYGTEYHKWMLANAAKRGDDGEESKNDKPKTPPPTFDLAKLANPDAGLTYHQTAMMSQVELILDKYLGNSFVDRRWAMQKDPQTDIETLQPVNAGTRLPDYVFQNKAKMSPFRAEDAIQGTSEAFYRNQYVFWITDDRQAHIPAFADIEDRVRRAWKIANSTGKSARDLARKDAERLAQEINGNKTTLKDRFADSPEVRETSEFTWFEDRSMGTGFGPLPEVRKYPIRTKLDDVDAAADLFFREVFRLADRQAGAAMNDAGSIVYAVQLFEAPQAKTDILREKFLKAPFSDYRRGLSFNDIPDEQGYAVVSAIDARSRSADWYDQFERDYDVQWESVEAR